MNHMKKQQYSNKILNYARTEPPKKTVYGLRKNILKYSIFAISPLK